MTYFGKIISVFIEISAKCRYSTCMRLRADTLFLKTKFIFHGVISVLSFYAVFAFQNCLLWRAERANMHLRKLRLFKCGILYIARIRPSAKKRNNCGLQ